MWTMKINVSNAQYAALMEIHGPPENVNSMIMCCAPKAGKWTLEGDAKDFEDLLSVIGEEIGEGICSQTNCKHLRSVCKKVDRSSLDWIGM